MTPPPIHPPVSVAKVLEVASSAILCGSAGWFHIPAGGYLNVTWLSRKGCYRVTIDVTPEHPLELAASQGYVAELAAKLGPA